MEMPEKVLNGDGNPMRPECVSVSDLIYSVGNGLFPVELWRMPLLDQDARPEPIQRIRKVVAENAKLSPDGKRLAYVSEHEVLGPIVYFTSLDGSEAKGEVFIGKGRRPRWSRNSNQIVYLYQPVFYSSSFSGQGTQLNAEPRREIRRFDIIQKDEWMLAGDQDRILAMVDADELFNKNKEGQEAKASADPIHLKIVANWFTELNKAVPTNED